MGAIMTTTTAQPRKSPWQRNLHPNIWATSLTSFFMDLSSEMVINLLPLFLSNVLGVKTNIIGLIEGIAEATASLLKMFSGWLSDKLRQRKWLAVAGYAISALVKPFFYIAHSWEAVAAVRWADRFGKGIRTAPRDALVADSVSEEQRGLGFGLQRAADTAGAFLGIAVALLVVWVSQRSSRGLNEATFRTIVLVSVIPAVLAVLSLALGARDVPVTKQRPAPKFAFRSLGKQFVIFMLIVGLFDLGNSSDAFLVLRAQERGLNVLGVLGMLATFNLVYTSISAPAGSLSDRIGRRKLVIGGWLVYALIYFGFAAAGKGWHVWALYALYGVYYGLSYGTAKAMIADIVPQAVRGTAYGTYNAVLGILDFPASLIAGLLWDGLPALGFNGFGPPAPFLFGATLALLAAIAMWLWKPQKVVETVA